VACGGRLGLFGGGSAVVVGERKTMRRPKDARRALLLGENERQDGVRGVLVRNGVLVVILSSDFVFPFFSLGYVVSLHFLVSACKQMPQR
jgi:hypothetical protein